MTLNGTHEVKALEVGDVIFWDTSPTGKGIFYVVKDTRKLVTGRKGYVADGLLFLE